MSDPAPPPAAPPATPPPATPPPAGKWFDGIKDEALRNDPFVSTAPDLDTFAKNAIATKAMTGRKAYDLPQRDWKPEQWEAWNKTIGVPEKPESYSPVDKAMLEKAGVDEATLGIYRARAHKLGITDRQFGEYIKEELTLAAQGREMQEQQKVAAKTSAESELKKEFGDKYEAKMQLVPVWLKQNANEGFLEAITKAGLDNDPAFVKAIIKSAEATLENNSRTGNTSNTTGTEGASALVEIEQMKARRLSDKTYAAQFENPKSEERMRWEELHKKAYNVKAA